jgi:hypothetical protein
MAKKFFLTESDRKEIRKMYLGEQEYEEVDTDEQGEEKKMFCNSQNTKSLDDIYGDDELHDEMKDIVLVKRNGVKGLSDKLEALKSLRMFPGIQDGGERLANGVMTTLQDLKAFNYFDEPTRKCCKAMDKVIELYKENEHGEDLVKDIEKVLAHKDPSPRAKEYLKRCIILVKEK